MTLDVRLTESDIEAIARKVAELLRSGGEPAADAAPTKVLFTEEEAAKQLSISHAALKKWRLRGLVSAATDTKPILYDRPSIARIAEWLASRGRAAAVHSADAG